MPEYLIANGYGMGRTWARVEAETSEQVQMAYPCFELITEEPAWLTADVKDQMLTTGLEDEFLKNICLAEKIKDVPLGEDPYIDFQA